MNYKSGDLVTLTNEVPLQIYKVLRRVPTNTVFKQGAVCVNNLSTKETTMDLPDRAIPLNCEQRATVLLGINPFTGEPL